MKFSRTIICILLMLFVMGCDSIVSVRPVGELDVDTDRARFEGVWKLHTNDDLPTILHVHAGETTATLTAAGLEWDDAEKTFRTWSHDVILT